jgi:hypothetical protein
LLLLLGFLSLCQISVLPGYLCLRAFRLPVKGLLQTMLYSFALTLVINHTLVYALYSARLYSAPVLYVIVTLEWLALFYLSLPSGETLARYRTLWRDHPLLGRLIVIPAFAALIAAAALCYQYFGSVFLLTDDVLSWDRWAAEWAENRLTGTGLYPQLLPTNWSITYVMLRNTDVKMFAKAIMPLFTLATLLLFLDLFHKTGRLTWILALSCYAFLLNFFFQPDFLASGYAEMANSFFAFLTLHAFLQRGPGAADFDAGSSRPFLVAVFASGTLLTKQGGVYVFALALGWLVVHFVRLRSRISWRLPALVLVVILLVNWRWVVTEWRVWHGQTLTNINYLTHDIHAGKTYPQRWKSAWEMIERVRGPECAPLILLIAGGVFLSLLHPHGRLVFLLMFAPFYVLWALLFSYETRTLAMDLPFAADCFACGVAAAAAFCLRGVRFVLNRLRRAPPPVRSGGARSKAAKRAIKKATAGKQSAKSSRAASGHRLTWLFGGAVLAALILSGAATWLGGAILRWVQSSRWLLDMAAGGKWSLAAGFGLAMIAPFAISRLSPLRLRLPAPLLLLALAGAIAAAQTTIWPSGALLRDQLEKRKEAGLPSLNRKLYEYARKKPLEGQILTDNYFLEFLPDLNRYQRYKLFPHPATPEFLKGVLADHKVRYILAYEPAFSPSVLIWMSQLGFQSIFEEQGYRFFELPANRKVPYPVVP